MGSVPTATAIPRKKSVNPKYIGLREKVSGQVKTSVVGFSWVLWVVPALSNFLIVQSMRANPQS